MNNARTYTLSFGNDLPEFPVYLWQVEVSAHCPKCQSFASINSVDDGGTMIVCGKCGIVHRSPMNSKDLTRSILKVAANAP